MAGIRTSIDITDRMSGALNRITAALNNTAAAFRRVATISEAAFNNTASVQSMTQSVASYESRIQQLETDLASANARISQMTTQTQRATVAANSLSSAFRLVGQAIGAIGIYKIIQVSDTLTQTEARIKLMNESFNEINDTAYETNGLINKIYQSAQNAGGSFSNMSAVVARFGNNAGDAFSSAAEVVEFAELVQKHMVIGGAATSEAAASMLQLSQALGSGVLRGEEFNSIAENAPRMIQNIADYLDVPKEKVRDMAKDGVLTADVVKNAIFSATDEINAEFEAMPMTWGRIWQQFKNAALMKFRPVLQRINEIANSTALQNFVNNAISTMGVLANTVLNIFDTIGAIGTFVADNWSIIEPIVMGVVTALGLYNAALITNNIVQGISTALKRASAVAAVAHGASITAEMTATTGMTAAQLSFNAALYACPVTWIIVAIIAIIAIVYAVCEALAKLTGVANSGFGVICGSINVAIQFFKNLGLTVANIALGIGGAIGALGTNIMTAFHNAICSVQSWWYDLLSTALGVVEEICVALNKLPFVEFDYSGITSAANDYAAKSAEAAGNKDSYVSVSDAFDNGMSTFDTFQDGWATDAFNSGASWGDGVASDVSSFVDGLFTDSTSALTSGLSAGLDSAYKDNDYSSLAGNVEDTADNTGAIADSIDISNENLEYLRDIAERDVINRFTTAEIKVEMTNNNSISSDMDLDGMVTRLSDGVNEAMEKAAEGVHE